MAGEHGEYPPTEAFPGAHGTRHEFDKPGIPLAAQILLNQTAQHVAFARAHLSHVETTFEQLKQTLGI